MTQIYRQPISRRERDPRDRFSSERSGRDFERERERGSDFLHSPRFEHERQQWRELAHEGDERQYGYGERSRDEEAYRDRFPSLDDEARETPYSRNYYSSTRDAAPWEGFPGERTWRPSSDDDLRRRDAQYGPLDDRYLGERQLDQGYHGAYRTPSRTGRSGDRFAGSATTTPRVGPKNYTRSDERLREDICDTLMQEYDLEVGDVSVEVKGGKVTLEGTVPQRYMKHRIEDIADRCAGVHEVDNAIRVKRAGSDSAQDSSSTATNATDRTPDKDSRARKNQH